MSIEVIVTAVNILVGIVLMGAIPWAFIIERRLARMEAALTTQEAQSAEIHYLTMKLHEVELELVKLNKGEA